ncbi:30S ribosome-binding factor RbfA [bacterium]|nr:30S ribosome-binding factor RbfA [bacterium]MBU1063708.1 30S ribosome-binding factor RbfA [bacterium]MBU1634390.1 30S ribosome-binding factor RbfA [bacterium]MBU1874327.1 30S ribosome-binding factor RbfA [bacterium]
MVDYRRQRVADEIKRIIGEIFIVDLPPEGSNLITVTNVKLTSDLREAKIYLSIYNKDADQRQQGLKNIIKKGSYIRGLLGNRISLRYVPKIFFYEDDTLEYVDKIERLIQTVHKDEEHNES